MRAAVERALRALEEAGIGGSSAMLAPEDGRSAKVGLAGECTFQEEPCPGEVALRHSRRAEDCLEAVCPHGHRVTEGIFARCLLG